MQAHASELQLADLHPAGYVIHLLDPETLLVAGRSGQGTGYAVDDLLKRFAGYRYFMPGPLGEIVPSLPEVALPGGLALREEPDLITYSNAGLWGGRGTFSRSWRTSVLATHNLSHIYPPEKYAESHPEYYPLVNGERIAPPTGPWNPCVSNPDLPAIAIEWARGYFEKNPDALGFSVGVNDGGGHCFCADCMAWEETYGNRYIPFYNEIARRAADAFPGKLVGFIAYGRAQAVPRNITLEPNLYVEVASGLRDGLAPLRQWHAAGARHTGHYGYLYGARYVVPRHYPHVLGEAWRRAHDEFGLSGAWVESYISNWLYDGPRQYVMNELAWDLDADIDALLEDYFTRFYAEAAEPMRRFFDRIEAIHRRKDDPLDFMGDSASRAMLAEYTQEDLGYLDQRLVEAASQVRDEDAAERLRLFQEAFGFTRLLLQTHLDIAALEALPVNATADAHRAVELVRAASDRLRQIAGYDIAEDDRKQIFIRTSFEDFKYRIQLTPALDAAADEVFSTITRRWVERGSWSEARSFWLASLERSDDPAFRRLVGTQLYLHEQQPEAEPLIPKTDLALDEPTPWGEVGRHLRGWSTFGFPNARADFYFDPTDPTSETGALAIGYAAIRGSFGRSIKVTPGQRYELSLRARYVRAGDGAREGKGAAVDLPATPPESQSRGSGKFTIRWRKDGRWADQGPYRAPRISVPFETDPDTGYAHLSTTFTVPEDVNVAMFLFGVSRQGEGERMAFDQIALKQIYEPEAD